MEALQFEHPQLLWLLGTIPLLLLAAVWNGVARKKAVMRWGDPALLQAMMPEYSATKRLLKRFLVLSGFAFLVVAAANPLVGAQEREAKREGIDIIVALDVSKSMLAEDLAPNRLERARQFISRLIDRLTYDRVGLVMFAGNAYLQMPMTIDHSAAQGFLKTLTPDNVPTQGTALAAAIQLSADAFARSKAKSKALILLSDGEDHEEGVMETVEAAVEQGLTLFTIGIGSSRGAPVPNIVNGVKQGFKTDQQGNIILSKLNEAMLNKLAIAGNGYYFNLSGSTDELNKLLQALGELEKTTIDQVSTADFVSYYQIPLALGLLLLLLDSLLGWHRNRFIAKILGTT